MSKRTYEEYIKNDCHPVGYNEACQRLIFSQISIDLLLDRIDQLNLQLKDYEDSDSSTMKYLNKQRDENIKLKQQLAEKDKEIESLKQQLEETNAGYDFTYEQSRETIKELKQNQTQLAIQELEKVKTWCDGIIRSNFDMTGSNKDKNLEVLSMKLDQQIKELKEKE